MFVSWFLVPWRDNPRVNIRMCDVATVSLTRFVMYRIEAE